MTDISKEAVGEAYIEGITVRLAMYDQVNGYKDAETVWRLYNSMVAQAARIAELETRPVTVQEAAKVLLDALGADGPFEPFMDAADAMLRDRRNGLGPIPMLGSALRALSETDT